MSDLFQDRLINKPSCLFFRDRQSRETRFAPVFGCIRRQYAFYRLRICTYISGLHPFREPYLLLIKPYLIICGYACDRLEFIKSFPADCFVRAIFFIRL